MKLVQSVSTAGNPCALALFCLFHHLQAKTLLRRCCGCCPDHTEACGQHAEMWSGKKKKTFCDALAASFSLPFPTVKQIKAQISGESARRCTRRSFSLRASDDDELGQRIRPRLPASTHSSQRDGVYPQTRCADPCRSPFIYHSPRLLINSHCTTVRQPLQVTCGAAGLLLFKLIFLTQLSYWVATIAGNNGLPPPVNCLRSFSPQSKPRLDREWPRRRPSAAPPAGLLEVALLIHGAALAFKVSISVSECARISCYYSRDCSKWAPRFPESVFSLSAMRDLLILDGYRRFFRSVP